MAAGSFKRGLGRMVIIAALFIAICLVRGPLEAQRALIVGDVNQEAARLQSLEGRASNVLLSGLRGPVVVGLWSVAEEEKNNEQWERLRTRYQMISALQPHFARVYEFNAWNLAYNISADQSDLTLRYQLIMDAVDFLLQGDREIPNSAVINWELYWLYKDKMGISQEADFYKSRFREQTRPRSESDKKSGPALVLANGTLNPAHPHYGRLDRIRPIRFNKIPDIDQPLPDPIPGVFLYGMSVFAGAYNYAERAMDCPEHPSKSAYMVQSAAMNSAVAWSEHVEQWADEAAGDWRRWTLRGYASLGERAPTEADLDRAMFLYSRSLLLTDLAIWRCVWMMRVNRDRRMPDQIPDRLRALDVWPASPSRPKPDDPRYQRSWLLPIPTLEVLGTYIYNLDKALWRRFRLASCKAELQGWRLLRRGDAESRQKALAVLKRSATLAARAQGLLVAHLRNDFAGKLPLSGDRMATVLLGKKDVFLRRYLAKWKVPAGKWDSLLAFSRTYRSLHARRRRIALRLAAM